MTFPKFYVESDGDRVPKDVYICAGDGLGRIATIEGASESTKFKIARFIVDSCNAAAAIATKAIELEGK